MRRNRIDLHVHSTASDGVLTPSEVVHLALEQGLSTIALTDHDTLAGISEAQAAAGNRLRVISGVEVSSEGSWGDLHFLGYFVDPTHPHLAEQLKAMRASRVGRAQQMVEKLAQMGMVLKWSRVQALAQGQSVGRPHVARALLEEGYVTTTNEAFDLYIGREGPAYAPRMRLTPTQVIDMIHQAGGVAVIAHPAQSNAIDRIEQFTAIGLQGVEVYYPSHTDEEIRVLLDLCRQHDLIATGGSDFHSPGHEEGTALGSIYVPEECVQQLEEMAGQG